MKKAIFLIALSILIANPAQAQIVTGGEFQLIARPSPLRPGGLFYQVFGTPGTTATRYYWVSAVYPQGESRFSGPIRPLNGPAVLNGTNYIRIAWTPSPGATSYNVVRTASTTYPTTANILVSNVTVNLLDDKGAGLTSYTLPDIIPPLYYSFGNGPDGQARIYADDVIAPTDNYLNIASVIRPVQPSPNNLYPLGHDMVSEANGPADNYMETLKAATTTNDALVIGVNANVLVSAVTVSSLIRGTQKTGTTTLFATAASLLLDRGTANYEAITPGNWSIVDSTHLSITCANNHPGAGLKDIEQLGIAIVTAYGIRFDAQSVSPAQSPKQTFNFFETSGNTIVSFPADVAAAWPGPGTALVGTFMGGNSANKDILFRNQLAASSMKFLSVANVQILKFFESAGNPLLDFGDAGVSSRLRIASSGAIAYMTAYNGLDFYTSGQGAGTSGVVSFRNNSTDATVKASIDGSTGKVTGGLYSTLTNCSSSASPAVCGSAAAGHFVIAAGATTVTVNTTAVTANSQIFLDEDQSAGTKLSVTCNTGISSLPVVSARVAATSFSVVISSSLAVNPVCYAYHIVN